MSIQYSQVPVIQQQQSVLPVSTVSEDIVIEQQLKQQSQKLSKCLKALIVIDALTCLAIFTIPQCAVYIILSAFALRGALKFRRNYLRAYYWVYVILAIISVLFSALMFAWSLGHQAGRNSVNYNNDNDSTTANNNDRFGSFPAGPSPPPSHGSAGSHGGQMPPHTHMSSESTYSHTAISGSAGCAWFLFTMVVTIISTLVFIFRVYTVILAVKLVRAMDKNPAVSARLGCVNAPVTAEMIAQPQPQQPAPYSVGMVNGQKVMFVPIQMAQQMQQQQQQMVAPQAAAAPQATPVQQTPAVQHTTLGPNMDLYPKINQ